MYFEHTTVFEELYHQISQLELHVSAGLMDASLTHQLFMCLRCMHNPPYGLKVDKCSNALETWDRITVGFCPELPKCF